MDAGGVVLGREDSVVGRGDVPTLDVVDRILRLTGDGPHAVATDELATLDPALEPLAEIAAGVLRVGRSDGPWVLWFRPEQRRSSTGAATRPTSGSTTTPTPRSG